MKTSTRRTRRFGACLATLTLVVAACGDDDDATGSDDTEDTAGTEGTAAPADTAADTPADSTDDSAGDTTPTDAGTQPAGGMPTELGEGEGEVNLIAWAGYVEDGSTDPEVDWVTPFEETTGCTVNVQLGNSSDEMVQLMQTGEYDGVSASGDATLRLIAGGEVAPVNVDLIPSYADVFEDLKLQPHNSVDGQPYGVPHGRGANLLVFNTELYTTPPDSWGEMFEADSAGAGAVSIYDSPIYIADAALYLMATQPDLGITNPYALDQAQFDAAIALLEAQEGLAGQYWSLYTDQQAALEGGTALVGTTWQVIVNLAQANGAKIDAVKPKEGATGWSDTWMISSQAAHPNCMYMWMDWIISPEANAAVAEWFGEAPSNAKSCDMTAVPEHCDIFHASETEYWEDVWYWTTPEETCLDGRADVQCVPYTEWVNAWNTLRA
jgi:putative spermidine/putrescine transport system substrate-binding protein